MIALPNWAQRLLAACVLLCCLDAAQAQDQAAEGTGFGLDPNAERYRLGQGLRLGDSGFTLGGYGTLSAGQGKADHAVQTDEGDWRAGLDSLSAFLWWNDGRRWSFFSETELEDSLIVESGTLTTTQSEVELERFYVDYARNDLLKLRVGKFLTPVGRWNLIHASPLVWTTSRPLITETTFPTNATGAMLYGVLPWTIQGVEYSFYYSPGTELARDKEIDTFSEAVGGHLSLIPLPYTQIGFSYVNFEQEHTQDEHKNLYGIDFVWARRRWEISGEFHYRTVSSSSDDRDETGLYLQAVAPLTERLYAVARYETYRRTDAEDDPELYLGGLNFRYRPTVVFKAEYSRASDEDGEFDIRDGFLASLAVLF